MSLPFARMQSCLASSAQQSGSATPHILHGTNDLTAFADCAGYEAVHISTAIKQHATVGSYMFWCKLCGLA